MCIILRKRGLMEEFGLNFKTGLKQRLNASRNFLANFYLCLLPLEKNSENVSKELKPLF